MSLYLGRPVYLDESDASVEPTEPLPYALCGSRIFISKFSVNSVVFLAISQMTMNGSASSTWCWKMIDTHQAGRSSPWPSSIPSASPTCSRTR